jgi:hypothetical protein
MKVVFIDEENLINSGKYFTLYKVYEAGQSIIFGSMYAVKNDKGYLVNVKKKRFMPLYEWRNKQIDEILKDE